jgi:hypothetical protein
MKMCPNGNPDQNGMSSKVGQGMDYDQALEREALFIRYESRPLLSGGKPPVRFQVAIGVSGRWFR